MTPKDHAEVWLATSYALKARASESEPEIRGSYYPVMWLAITLAKEYAVMAKKHAELDI
jgi:hypothetical protein